ncbi:hypothetical protein PQU95_06185 [Vogesella sp. DC21W]|uniref:Flagellar hook-length control protein FliK n=1 Tax=Vogesella aquatica TaxID=2984206 RepID=A0ABT5IW51_9NEIS|nr:hypothetical protein [Vogesella aquatica]MDC7716804.1 hypothetical protein [Vogesella aquatica]
MDISSTNPLSPSPLYRDSTAARQRELPQTGSLESAGQQALEASTAREAQLQAATQQVASKPENAAPQQNKRATDLQFSLQAQLLSTQAVRVQQAQQRTDNAVTTSSEQPVASQPAANPGGNGNSSTNDATTATSPPSQTTAQQTAAPRSTPQQPARSEDSSRAELNASAQQQAVAQYQASQSILQSSSGVKFSA